MDFAFVMKIGKIFAIIILALRIIFALGGI